MKQNMCSLIAILMVAGLAVSACGGVAPSATITSPTNGTVIQLSASTHPDPGHDSLHWDPGSIGIAVNYPERAHTWDIQDNGQSSVTPSNTWTLGNSGGTIFFRWEPATLGLHTITVRAGVQDNNGQTHWSDSTSITVCVINDPVDPVPNVPIGAIGNCVIPPTIPPTVTPTPIVIIRPDDNGRNPSGGNPSGATGCGQYGDVTSCDLAGCSWNGSSCIVSP